MIELSKKVKSKEEEEGEKKKKKKKATTNKLLLISILYGMLKKHKARRINQVSGLSNQNSSPFVSPSHALFSLALSCGTNAISENPAHYFFDYYQD